MLNRRNSKKGFTLVELIVVLVIIAILAAVAIPAMLGFTDEAKEKEAITEAKAALNATESMMSDAYTDGRKTLSVDVREKCYQTSGLDYDTEFTVWTVDSMQNADGTYKTTKSYTINQALYKTKDGRYVYYDSNNSGDEWRVLDSTDPTDQALISKSDGNIIYVWHFPSNTHKVDTAIDYQYADGDENISEEPEDEVDNNKGDLGPEYNKEPDAGGGEQDDSDYTITVTLVGSVGTTFSGNNITALGFTNAKATTNADGEPSLTIEYTKQGLSDNPVFAISPLYDEDKLTWSSDSTPWSQGVISSKTDILSYLSELYSEYDSDVSVTLTSSIGEKTCEIPVAFIAYSNSTQNVEVTSSKAEDKISDANNLKDTVFYNVGLVSGEIDKEDSKYVDVSGNGVVSVNNAASVPDGVVVYNNDWVPGFYGSEISYYNSSYETTTSDYYHTNLSEVEDWVQGYVENKIAALDLSDSENADNVVDTFINDASEGGVTFVAPADIYKTVYLKAKEEDAVEFKYTGSEDTKKEFDKTFAQNELSDDIYVVENGAKSTDPIDDSYSILGSENLSLEIKNSKKFKIWEIYDCSKSGVKSDNVVDKKTRDLDDVLDRLYTDDEDFGELCEVDVSLLTTLLANTEGSDTATSPLAGMFTSLSSGASSIESIEYINKDDRFSYGYGSDGFKEVCISTTTLSGSPFVPADDSVTLDYMDEEYPAYTVAFTSNNGTNIYVFTEDDTEMKAKDSLKGLHSGFSAMEKNSFVEKINAGGVTNLESMFEGCSALTSGAADGVLNLDNISSSGVISTEKMFYNCAGLESVSLGGLGEASVLESTKSMFEGCGSLSSLAIDSFDTQSVSDMSLMFKGCSELTKIGTGSSYVLKINSADTIASIFEGCTNLETISISGGGTTSVPCPILKDGMTDMFKDCNSLATVKVQDSVFSNLDVLTYIFQSDKQNLVNSYLTNTKIKGSTSLSGLFAGCSSLAVATFDDESTQHITDMSNMFNGCSALVNGEDANVESAPACLVGLNAENATNLISMFEGCTGLKSTAVGFNTSNATKMERMFYGCTGLVNAKVRIDRTTNIKELFCNCTSLDKVVLCGGSQSVEAALGNGSDYTDCFKGAGKRVGPNNTVGNIDITLENITFSKFTFKKPDIDNLTVDQRCTSDSDGKNCGLYKMFNSARANAHSITIQNVTFNNMYSMDYAFAFKSDMTYNENNIRNNGFKELTEIKFINVDAPRLGRMKGTFSNNPKLETIELTNFNVPQAWNYSFMFSNNPSLTTITLNNFNVLGAAADFYTDYSAMFKDCRNLTAINGLQSFDTRNARDMKYMFANCFNIGNGTLDISNFDTSNVRTDYIEKNNPYTGKPQIAKYRAEGFNQMFGTVNNATDSTSAAYYSNLKTIIVSDSFVVNWNINPESEDPDLGAPFNNMFGSGLIHLNEDGGTMLSTSKISGKDKKHKYFAWIDGVERTNGDKQGYFHGVQNKKAFLIEMGNGWPITIGIVNDLNDIKGFEKYSGTGFATTEELEKYLSDNNFNYKDMTYKKADPDTNKIYKTYFWYDSNDQKIKWWSEGNVIYMSNSSQQLFNSWAEVLTIDLKNFDFSAMTKDKAFKSMFNGCKKLTNIYNCNLTGASAKGDTKQMFYGCESLTSISFINQLDTSQVTDMQEFFCDCKSLSYIDLTNMNTSNVTNMVNLFKNCTSLKEVDISGLDTSKATTLKSLFDGCSGLVTVDLGLVETTSFGKEATKNMFKDCSALKTIYVSENFNLDKVTTDNDMFLNCSSLVGGSGTIYDPNHIRKEYAHIDGSTTNPGYFTQKPSN